MRTRPRQRPQPARPRHTLPPGPSGPPGPPGSRLALRCPRQGIALGSGIHPGPSLACRDPLIQVHSICWMSHYQWDKGIPLASGPPGRLPSSRRQETAPGGDDAREAKPDRDPLQTPDPPIPPRPTRSVVSKDKTSDKRDVPYPGSPAFHGGTPPAPLLCTGREGAGSPQGPLLGLTQRAPKSQPVTPAPILTAELGPASPSRTRSCNRTRSSHGATSRRKPPPATHTAAHVAPTEAPLRWEFVLCHFLGWDSVSFLGWDRRKQEPPSQNLLHGQQPRSALYPFPHICTPRNH